MKKKALILAGIPWNTTIQRHHKVAYTLRDLGYDVFFVEAIPSSAFTFEKLFNKLRNKNKNSIINVEKNNINVIKVPFINPMRGLGYLWNVINVNKLLYRLPEKFDLIINYLPINTTYYLIRKAKYDFLIYDCVRNFKDWGGYYRNLLHIEARIAEIADVITTDSYYLTYILKERYFKKKIVQILPTVSNRIIDLNSNYKCMNPIKRLTYFGYVSDHIDIDLLNRLSDQNYIVNIIGIIDNNINLNKKIIYHGFIENETDCIKKIIEVSDAIIIPYKGNVDGVIPAKLTQAISTYLPIFINEFYDSKLLDKYVYIYKDLEDLLDKIHTFDLKSHNEKVQEMKNFARQNSDYELQNKIKDIFKNN